MKRNYLFVISAIILSSLIFSCQKTSFITSGDALLFTSADTLHFGTVFTNTGSITQSFKIFNPNDQKLLLNQVALLGGTASAFKLNIDGSASPSFSNIEIAPNDSIYIFVEVNISNGATNLPFFIQDSIGINYNGKETFVQLDAYGQNARFLNNASVTKDTSWSSDLPVVIIGALNVNQGKTLTINKGVRVYCHADAAITINGTLKTLGEKDESDRIIFRGDRLDDYYKDLPGSWPGISFAKSSINNQLNYTGIYNATNAVIADNPATNNSPKIVMNQCIINNASATGIFSVYSSINATNCLISNCGNNIQIAAGGTYNFTNCTVVSYNTNFLFHETPVLSVNDADDNNQVFPLNANFINSIFYGDDGFVTDEISVQQSAGNQFHLNFENVLYKAAGAVPAEFTNSIQNTGPVFATIDYTNNKYDFHLLPESPCVNAGKTNGLSIDLDGNPRDSNVDIGCYELQ
ncbi:MAG: choice-of-anchor Q domain-containing protein [Panacibacter sp.]